MSRFAGHSAVVTGAGQGIGLAIARRLAADGAAVVVTDIRADTAEKAAASIAASGGTALAMSLDVTDDDQMSTMMAQAEELVDAPVDIVVANAGVQTFNSLMDVSRSEWDLVMGVNAWGAFQTIRAAGLHLRTAGRPGSVVVMASRTGRVGAMTSAHYAASKAAALNLVKSCALEFAPDNVRVNAVAPGMVDTELWDKADAFASARSGVAPGQPRQARIAEIPLRRPAQPHEIAGVVAFLASSDASYLSGECIHVSGGDYML